MSTVSTIPFWGQAWELTVDYQTQNGLAQTIVSANGWEPEALRIAFEVLQSTLPSPWWFADVTVYNLNVPDLQNLYLNAVAITLKAGFQTGAAKAGVIWSGPVLQALLGAEGVVDNKLTFHCVANPAQTEQIVSFSMTDAYATQANLIAAGAAQIGLPPMSVDNGTLSPYAASALQAKQYPRGNTVFGKYGKYLAQVSDDQFMTTYRDGAQTYMTEISDGKTVPTPDLIYTSPNPPGASSQLPPNTTQTLIGTPHQTPEGAVFTVLLDPRLRVQLTPHIQVVRLISTNFSQAVRQIAPSGNLIPPISNLVMFVGQVRHVGDSRGNDWYTEVTGYNTTYGANLLDGIFSANSSGGQQ